MEFKRGYGLGLFQPMKKENLDKLYNLIVYFKGSCQLA